MNDNVQAAVRSGTRTDLLGTLTAAARDFVAVQRIAAATDREYLTLLAARAITASLRGEIELIERLEERVETEPNTSYVSFLVREAAAAMELLAGVANADIFHVADALAHRMVVHSWSIGGKEFDWATWLVSLSMIAAVGVRKHEPALADRWATASSNDSTAQWLRDALLRADTIAEHVLQYGATAELGLIDRLSAEYQDAVLTTPAYRRFEMLLAVIDIVRQHRLGPNAYFPFLYRDTDARIVTTAALHAAEVYTSTPHDYLHGPRELAANARACAGHGEDLRAADIFSGLIAIGDRRIVEQAGPCWRYLSSDGKRRLSRNLRGTKYAPIVDWLVSWLEECEDEEFGDVAGVLASLAQSAQPELFEVRRKLPNWDPTADDALVVHARWSCQEYGEKLRPRLLQLAADEHAPRVMHDVLGAWGIGYHRRLHAGIHMRPVERLVSGAALPSRVRDSISGICETGLLERAVALSNEEFEGLTGRIVVCWAIFNPHGPTWFCIGIARGAPDSASCLFCRMLHPFGQQGAVVGVLQEKDVDDAEMVGRLVARLFEQECLETIDGRELHVIGDWLPTLVEIPWANERVFDAVRAGLHASPVTKRTDVVRESSEFREHWCQPWERTGAQAQAALERMDVNGLVHPPPTEKRASAEAIDDWLSIVGSMEHRIAELLSIPTAWHGAIATADAPVAQNAFTFWQLDEFLSRFGYTFFRELADEVTRREHEARMAERTTEPGSVMEDAQYQPDEPAASVPGYRERYDEQISAYLDRSEDSIPSDDRQYHAAFNIVAGQLAEVEDRFEEEGRAAAEIDWLMRRPWPLGYLYGVMSGFLEIQRGVEQSESAADDLPIMTGALAAGHRTLGYSDAERMVTAAHGRPGFDAGFRRAYEDLVAFVGTERPLPMGLVEWLCENGQRGGPRPS